MIGTGKLKIGELKEVKRLIKEDLGDLKFIVNDTEKLTSSSVMSDRAILYFNDACDTIILEEYNKKEEQYVQVNLLKLNLDKLIRVPEELGIINLFNLYGILYVYLVTIYNLGLYTFVCRRDSNKFAIIDGLDSRRWKVHYHKAGNIHSSSCDLFSFFFAYKPLNYNEVKGIRVFER